MIWFYVNSYFEFFFPATSGDRDNNNKFSHCSKANISAVLDAIVDKRKDNCFVKSDGAFCGKFLNICFHFHLYMYGLFVYISFSQVTKLSKMVKSVIVDLMIKNVRNNVATQDKVQNSMLMKINKKGTYIKSKNRPINFVQIEMIFASEMSKKIRKKHLDRYVPY